MNQIIPSPHQKSLLQLTPSHHIRREKKIDNSVIPSTEPIKDYFTSVNETNRYVSGKHFTKNTICAPSKTKSDEKITGRAVIDLAKLCLRNIKKAVVRAEEYLSDGELPSGRIWDDLYAHVILKHTEQFPKDKTFNGFMALYV